MSTVFPNGNGNNKTLPERQVMQPLPKNAVLENTPLVYAISLGNLQRVQVCLQELQETKKLAEALATHDAAGKNPFTQACSIYSLNCDIIKCLLPHINSEILTMQDYYGNSALTYILRNKSLEEISCELIRLGFISASQKDQNGNTILMQCIASGHHKTVRLILTLPPENLLQMLKMKNNDDEDALDIALKNGEYQLAELLVKMGCDVEEQNTAGYTRLTLVIETLHDDAIQSLLKFKANINTRNRNGDTPLIYFVRKENEIETRYLLEQGADTAIQDANGKTALEIARGLPATEARENIIYRLTASPRYLRLPIDYRKMLLEALYQGDLLTLIYTKNILGENLKNKLVDGISLIHIAAKLGHFNIVEYLIDEEEVSFDKEDVNRNTPFMYAVAFGHFRIVRYLEDLGVDIMKKNNSGETAFNLAMKNKHREIAQFLKERENKDNFIITNFGVSNFSLIEKNIDSKGNVNEVPTLKGHILLLESFNRKVSKRNKIPGYIAENLTSLEHALSLLATAKNGTQFGLIANVCGHYVAIKCEKFQGKKHIILMDSVGSLDSFLETADYDADNYAEIIENLVEKLFGQDKQNTFFYKNEEGRQTSLRICGVFSAKDLRKMLNISCVSQLLFIHKHIKEKTIKGGVTVFSYRTPPEFMRLTESPTKLAAYIKENKTEAEKILRRNKNGQPQKLNEYALTPRDKFGVKTPERTENRDYDPNNPNDPDKPEYVYKNRTILYFAYKYKNIIENFIRIIPIDQLKFVFEKLNAAQLKCLPDGTVLSQREEEIYKLQFERKKIAELEKQKFLEKQRLADALEQQRRLALEDQQRLAQERKDREEKKMYEEIIQQKQKHQSLKMLFVKADILQENDVITELDLFEYVNSRNNGFNGQFIAPSLFFSEDTILKFDMNRIAYLREIAKELRTKVLADRSYKEPQLFSIQAQACSGGITNNEFRVRPGPPPPVGEAHAASNTEEFVNGQPSAKKRKVTVPIKSS